MPSPFPGVDPYIKAESGWGDFHSGFLTYCRDAIGPCLPEDYVARFDAQVRLVLPSMGKAPNTRLPDIAILRDPELPSSRSRTGGGLATLEPVSITVETEDYEEVRETWIEILKLPDLELVTVIELLSPTNKIGQGREGYLDKRRKLLAGPAHLVEIDLLLGGHRMPMRPEKPLKDFAAMVSRVEGRPKAEVYTWSIREPLPPIPIPLSAPDPDVWLDLAPPYVMAYERGYYARILKYKHPLPFPFSAENQAWAEETARQWGHSGITRTE